MDGFGDLSKVNKLYFMFFIILSLGLFIFSVFVATVTIKHVLAIAFLFCALALFAFRVTWIVFPNNVRISDWSVGVVLTVGFIIQILRFI